MIPSYMAKVLILLCLHIFFTNQSIASTISFSHSSGIYTAPVEVTVATPPQTVDLRYTIDGSLPSFDSPILSQPILVEETTLLRVGSFDGESQLDSSSLGLIIVDSNVAALRTRLPVILAVTLDSLLLSDRNLTPVLVSQFDAQTGDLRLIDRKPKINFAGLRIRGQTSQWFAKQPYAVEFWQKSMDMSQSKVAPGDGQDRKVRLFDLPKESDWVLHGPYSDKTLIRNYLAYKWARDIDSSMGPRARLAEVFITHRARYVSREHYRGVYLAVEKIKVGPHRVNIEKLRSNDLDDETITGGYLFKRDKVDPGEPVWYTSLGHPFISVSPKPNVMQPEQLDYLINYLNQIEEVLIDDPDSPMLAEWLDLQRFARWWLQVEFTKNIDGFRFSTYYYKDRGGKLKIGPAWDYNLSLGNANYYQGAFATGWYSSVLPPEDYPHWQNLHQSALFNQILRAEWQHLRNKNLATDQILGDIDRAVAWLAHDDPALEQGEDNPLVRNFQRWPVLGRYIWPNPYFGRGDYPSGISAPESYQDEINLLKNFLRDRLQWMDDQLGG